MIHKSGDNLILAELLEEEGQEEDEQSPRTAGLERDTRHRQVPKTRSETSLALIT